MDALTKVLLLIVSHELYGTESYKDLPQQGCMPLGGWGWTSKCIIDAEGNPFNGVIKGKSELCYPWQQYKALVKEGQVYEMMEFDKVSFK